MFSRVDAAGRATMHAGSMLQRLVKGSMLQRLVKSPWLAPRLKHKLQSKSQQRLSAPLGSFSKQSVKL